MKESDQNIQAEVELAAVLEWINPMVVKQAAS